jgi:hypothetical protein
MTRAGFHLPLISERSTDQREPEVQPLFQRFILKQQEDYRVQRKHWNSAPEHLSPR